MDDELRELQEDLRHALAVVRVRLEKIRALSDEREARIPIVSQLAALDALAASCEFIRDAAPLVHRAPETRDAEGFARIDWNLAKHLTDGVERLQQLSDDQRVAWDKIVRWLSGREKYFVLRGYAGTGKTFMMRMLADYLRGRVRFSATTNKAAKVLGQSVGSVAKTVHSTLGLRMVEDDDRMVLSRVSQPPYIPPGTVLVVDESSMAGRELYEAIRDTVEKMSVRVMFVGDPAQLPPVGEARSPVWGCTDDPECRAFLKQVMRNGDLLLDVATELRERMKTHNWRTPLTDRRAGVGVEVHESRSEWREAMLSAVAVPGQREAKVVAFRNVVVDGYNVAVRKRLGFTERFNVGDCVLLAAPLEVDGQLLAHTDDEFTVETALEDRLKVYGAGYIDTWSLSIRGDTSHRVHVCRDDDALNAVLNERAAAAKSSSGSRRAQLWREFWEVRRAFTQLRYGYALTSHRSQGSTYESVYIDQEDILSLSDKRTSFRSLYVAATRPSKLLSTF